MSMKKIGLSVLILLGLLTAAFFLLPQSNCDDSSDPQLKVLSGRAEKGDMQAISTLYSYNKSKEIKPLEEYWALEGALQGDVKLRREYVSLFKSRFGDEERKQIIEVVRGQSKRPGTACLLAFLTDDKAGKTSCPQ